MAVLARRPSLRALGAAGLAWLVLTGAAAEGGQRGRSRPPERLVAHALEHDGLARRYFLNGSEPDEGERRPLLVVLHGGQGSPERIAETTRFGEIARREGFMVAYPEAVDRNWNDGRAVPRYRSHREEIDDVGFVSTLIDRMVAARHVDRDRVYVVGPSNGGMMTYRLVLEAPDRFAAAAAVIANLPEQIARAHAGPAADAVPLLILNGTADPLMPYRGGEITFGIWGGLGRVLSTDSTARFFAVRGGCEPEPRRREAEDADPHDSIEVERHGYGAAENGCEVELYVLVGGGHTWPGGAQNAPRSLVGPATRSLDASELIWSFFARHSR